MGRVLKLGEIIEGYRLFPLGLSDQDLGGEKPALLAYPFLAIPVSAGNKDYLAWIGEVTGA